jgi:lantibiotic modifying enzyme
MGLYTEAALEAVNFIAAQRLDGRAKWRRSAETTSSDYSLYHGSCGIILLLLELHAATGDDQALGQAIAAGEEVASHLGRIDRLSVSTSTGWPGYAFALNELAQASGREDFRVLATTCLERLRIQASPLGGGIGWIEPMPFSEITGFTGDREIYDQSVGAAGAGLVLLYGDRRDLHPKALDWAVAAGERLLEVAESDAAGLRWRMMADMPFAFTAPNFAHGGAGVGYFMAELHKATGEPRFLDAAIQAARYVLSRSTAIGDGRLICHTEEATPPIFYLGACHGPAGTGRLLLELGAITGEASWLDEARALTRGLLNLGAPETRSKGLWNNHGQCCGDAGLGEYALLMARRTDETKYLDLARRCADVILARSSLASGQRSWTQAEHRDRPTFLETQTGYMQGAAGIASFLLHLDTTLEGAPVKIALPDWPGERA